MPKITHQFVSSVPAGGDPGDVTTTAWNQTHNSSLQSEAFTANTTLPTSGLDRFQVNTSGITITLPSAAANAGLMFYGMMGVAGSCTIVDAAGANFYGPGSWGVSSWEFSNQGQWGIFISDGANWIVMGN